MRDPRRAFGQERVDPATRTPAERAAPEIVAARGPDAAVQPLVRKRDGDGLEAWMDPALTSSVASFAKRIAADRAAVSAAIRQPWSNGQTEGRIRRQNTVKRQMGGGVHRGSCIARGAVDEIERDLAVHPVHPAGRSARAAERSSDRSASEDILHLLRDVSRSHTMPA